VLDAVSTISPPLGEITQPQLEWLESLLAIKTDKPRLFFLHHDLFSGHGVKNHEEAQKILQKHPGEKWFFTGHWHADCFVKIGDQRHVITTSISYLFDQDRKFKHSRQVPGYRLIYFRNGEISTRFKPLGKNSLPDPEIKDYFSLEEIKQILKTD